MFGLFKKAKRSYEAAKHNRLVKSWQAVSRSINADTREGIDAVRGRARDLAQNEPMVKKYLSLVAANVVGSNGFVLQARVTEDDKQDKAANVAIEKAWAEFSRAGVCDISGRMSMPDFQRAGISCIARDGEALIFEHHDAENEFGYALQLLDINRLATALDRKRQDNINAIIMGVEINKFGRPVNYHLYDDDDVGEDVKNRRTKPYPASQIIHLFLTDSPEQVRGVSWLHASMIRMFHLKKYQEWAIIAAGVGASKMGFFTSPEGDGTALADEEDEETGELFQEASGGQFGVLPEGWGFESFNPDYPHTMYPEFIKTAKRDIAGGLNVSYHSLANDLEGVNFSSIRSGTLEEREQWKVIQDWFISCFLERIYTNWITSALLKGAIKSKNGKPLPASKTKTQFIDHEFLGRRWSWVDPLKDVQANVEAMDNALLDPYTIAAQQGLDIDEVLDGIARYQAAIKEKKIRLGAIEKKTAKTQGQDSLKDVPDNE